MTPNFSRPARKRAVREQLRTAQVSPIAMTALYILLLIALDLLDAVSDGAGVLSTFIGLLTMLLGLVLGAGYTLYCMAVSRGERAEYLTLFDAFSFVGRLIGLHLLIGILVGLWSLLFVIPGIVAYYRYRFAPLYLYEHPERGILEALRESCRLTRGYKASLFTLDLSYIGWGLLAYLPSVVVNFIYYNRLALNTFNGIPDATVVLPGVLGTIPSWGWVLIHGIWLLAVAPFFLPHYQCVEISYYETAKGGDGARPDPDGLGGL